ncbi:acyl-CoA thioesterase [Lentzea tibetensis]|uniref:Acyl-CoA thioesterase n=1 Tax=Lentzea tibetensis TaxID=2591470 RepID=A0A563ES12_9PSEU|nr:thioesterase family protein [Lentzea tibetensis]TWP50466.1 acyl-CoA thioesterase [Lentzea tibetensis]
MTAQSDGVVPSYSFTPRFYEIDGQGVMFNMWYLGYLDEAIDAFFIERGLPYKEWRGLGFDVHVVHVDLDFSAGVRNHDRAVVLISTSRLGGKSFTLDFAFRRDGEIACAGGIVYATVAADGSGTIALPDRLVEALGEVNPLRAARPS